jgi:hypothetical protein
MEKQDQDPFSTGSHDFHDFKDYPVNPVNPVKTFSRSFHGTLTIG